METILKLKTYVDGVNDTPFPSKDSQISTSSFKFDAKRMGSAPTISASIQCTKSMDAYWNYKVYADFNGERFFLKQIPSGTISNERDGFKYDITLVSERSVLENVYFYDVVTTSGNDKPVSNSSIFSFFGDLNEFASRLKRSLQYSGVSYDVLVDSDVRLEPKMVSFQDKYVLDALKDSYGIFKVPFYFVARTIHFGYNDKNNEISEVFRYGDEYSLLSIQKQNTNQPIVTKITGFGSDVNVPYYYPNETARGDLGLNVLSGTNNYRITSMNAFANYVGVGERILYTEGYVENVSDRFSNNGSFYDDYTKPIEFLLTTRVRNIKYKKKFRVVTGGFIDIALGIKIDGLYGKTDDYLKAYELYDSEKNNVPITIKDGKAERIWIQETGEYELISYWEFVDDSLNPKPKPEPQPEIASIGSKAAQAGGDKTDNEDSGEPGGHPDEPQDPVDPNDSENYISVEFGILVYTTPYWKNTNSDRVIELNKIGVVCDTTPSVGDSFTQYVVRYIKPAPKLMPSIYRDSLAEDRFYEARNGVYESPNGGTYEFKNTFESNNPKERIVTFDDVKPTIKGMVNAIGERIDIFSAFAFDSDDSDEQEEIDGSLEYKHPYFFAKLRKFDGENGFNLFDQAIENDEMYISFTNGTLGGCKFKIAVSSNDGKSNLVQVDKNGNLVRDDKTGDVICGRKPYQASVKAQEEQNDTSKYEVWIALEKDFETFGTLLPNNYAPSSGSTFVILNILLPNAYIKNAEKELDRKLIEYMSNHNDEKFNFSIDFSRIYLAEHKEILSHLGENSKIRVSYDGNQYDLYTSSFTYEANEDEILPKIRIDLSDSVELYENYVETSIKRSEKTTNNKISKKANRATTTSGYGIRNAVNHVTSNGKGNVITKISVSGNNLNVEYGQPITSDVSDGSSDLFRKVNIGTEEKPEYAIKALFGLYSEQFITAKGHSKDEGGKPSTGGIIKIVYGSKDLGKVFDDKNLTDTFNAFTINAINERLKKVEQGSGIALNLNPLTINVNGNNFVTYNPKEDGKTLNIKAGENISIDTDSLGNVTINAVNTGGGVGEITLADWNRVAQLEGNKYIGDKNNRNYIYIQEDVEVQKGFKFTSTPMVGNTNVALVTDIPTIPSLDGYATEQWVLDKKYLTSHQTIYGINFNIDSLPFLEYLPNFASKNINLVPGDNVGFVVDKSSGKITINATDTIYTLPTATSSVKGGVKVGDTLSISNEVLNLKSIISTTGTYTKVTVDTYGRVTSGSTLLEDDIPTLSIGKIDGLKDALDSKLDKNDFDSLFVKEQYGDTFVIKAKFGLYTDQFLSAKGIGGGGSQPIGITKYAQLPDKPSINGIVLEGNKTTEQLGIIVSSGTTDYGDLSNKPKINNKTLVGNMSLDTLGIQPKGNYLTEHQSLIDYALKTDIPSLTGYATEQWVKDQKYLTQHQSLANYYTSAKVDELLTGKLDKSVFDDLFEKVNLGTTAAPQWTIRAKYGLYSDGFLSAKGMGSGGGGTIVGTTDYTQLTNKPRIEGVTLTGNVTLTQLGAQPSGDYALKTDIPSMGGYATRTWVENQGYLTSVGLDEWNAAAQEVGEKYIGNSSNGSWIYLQEDVKVERNCNFAVLPTHGTETMATQEHVSGNYLALTGGTMVVTETNPCVIKFGDVVAKITCSTNGYEDTLTINSNYLELDSSDSDIKLSGGILLHSNYDTIEISVTEDFDYTDAIWSFSHTGSYSGTTSAIFKCNIASDLGTSASPWGTLYCESIQGETKDFNIVSRGIISLGYEYIFDSTSFHSIDGVDLGTSALPWGTLYCDDIETNNVIHAGTGIVSDGYITAKQASDKRLKTNFDYSIDYQEKLLSLGRICDFNYTDEAIKRNEGAVDNSRHTGLIWQEAKQVGLNNFSIEDKDGYGALNYLSVDYINTIAGAAQLTILGLRNVKSDVDVLKEKLEKANKRIKELEDKIYEC